MPANCSNCGRSHAEHISVNYSDGEFVSRTVNVCPTSVYKSKSVLKRELEKKEEKK